MKGWSDVVELLLKSKADANICDMVSVYGELVHVLFLAALKN